MLHEHIDRLVQLGYALAQSLDDLENGYATCDEYDRDRDAIYAEIEQIKAQYAPAFEDNPQYWTRDALQ